MSDEHDQPRGPFPPITAFLTAITNTINAKPHHTERGQTDGIRWEYRLFDEPHANEVLVELPRRRHPRAVKLIRGALRNYQILNAHECSAHADPEWHLGLHISVVQSEPCEEIAHRVAAAVAKSRVGFCTNLWIRIRTAIAKAVLPDGLEVSPQ